MIKASFSGAGSASIDLSGLQGYRISGRLEPGEGRGIGGEFYIYLVTRLTAGKQLTTLRFDDDLGPVPGKLEIAGDNRDYTFECELIRSHTGMTRRERYQILEFQVRFDPDDPPTALAENSDTIALQKLRTLGDDYKFSVNGGEAEHLMGFSSLISATGNPMYRFSALRNKHNSWIEAALEWNEAILSGNAEHAMTVDFSQHDFELNRETMAMLYFDESFGVCHHWQGLSLRDIASPPTKAHGGGALGARLPLWEYFVGDLMEHEHQSQGEYAVEVARRSVESATLVFQPGYYHTVEIY